MKVVFSKEQLIWLENATKRLNLKVSRDKNERPDYKRLVKTLSQKFTPGAIFVPLSRNEVRAVQSLCVASIKALDSVMEVYRERGDKSEAYLQKAERTKEFVQSLQAHIERYL